MNDAERNLIADLFKRIRGAETAARDPEAEAYIADQVSRQPHAPYAMAQTVVVQDRALDAAKARIEELEQELADARAAREDRPGGPSPWGSRAQDAMGRSGGFASGEGYPRDDYRRDDDGRGGYDRSGGTMSPPFGAPRSYPGAQPTYGSQQTYGAQAPAQEPSRGGGFLSGALQTAAGVAGGALLFQGIRSLFGGDEAQAHTSEASRLAEGAASEGSNESVSDAFSGWFGDGKSDAAKPDAGQSDADNDADLAALDDLDADADDDRWI